MRLLVTTTTTTTDWESYCFEGYKVNLAILQKEVCTISCYYYLDGADDDDDRNNNIDNGT
jgi:hypothetical protein